MVIFSKKILEGSPPVLVIRQSINLLCDHHGTYQSVDKGINKTTIMRKILEASYGKMLNPVYQN